MVRSRKYIYWSRKRIMFIETTHHVSDSTVSACIPGMKVQLHVVHPAAVLLTKVQP